jgi:hypothetical protein
MASAGRALDNIFDPGPRPSDSLDNPTRHNGLGGGGYLSVWCTRCGTDDYPNDAVMTRFCEDAEWAKKKFAFEQNEKKLIAERRHVATEEAIRVARTVLSEVQWDLLGIKVAPYRDIDRIIIG